MSQLNNIKSQIMKLRIEERKIEVYQERIGKRIYELYEQGQIHDEIIKGELDKIINSVTITEQDIRRLWSGF